MTFLFVCICAKVVFGFDFCLGGLLLLFFFIDLCLCSLSGSPFTLIILNASPTAFLSHLPVFLLSLRTWRLYCSWALKYHLCKLHKNLVQIGSWEFPPSKGKEILNYLCLFSVFSLVWSVTQKKSSLWVYTTDTVPKYKEKLYTWKLWQRSSLLKKYFTIVIYLHLKKQ